MWYRVNTDDERAMEGSGPSAGCARGRAAPGGTADDPVVNESANTSNLQDRPTGGPVGNGLPVGAPDSDEAPPAGGLPADGPADDSLVDGLPGDSPVEDLSADASPAGGLPAGGSADDPADDGAIGDPADTPPDDGPDGGGVSPVVREYVERLRREALARDAELRARGIDPYKGTGVDEGPRRRLGARALVALIVLVAAVSVGAYVVFLRGEPDYGMSHGYQVQSDGSLKRPPITDKAPDKPAEMSKGDEAGAEATARYYLKAYSYAWNTGDTGPLKSISDENCQFCKSESSRIDEFYAHGSWAAKGYTDVIQTQAIEKLPESEYGPDAYAVQFRIDEHLAEGYTSSGFQEGRTDQTVIKLHVQWDGNAWHVLEGRAKNANDVE